MLGTFGNPIPIGTGYTFPGLGTLAVEESLWEANQTGLAIVRLSFTCERPAGQTCETKHFMLDAVGGSGSGYNQDFDRAIPDPDFGSIFNPAVYGGGREEGYVAFLVTGQEEWLLMRVSVFLKRGEVFFRIS